MNREKAIEIVRSNFPNGRSQLSEALITLIPELKESGDEKMIRLIKTALCTQSVVLAEYYKRHNITEEEIFAWLEKQGENKHTWSKEDEKMINDIRDEIYPYGKCPDYPTKEEQDYYYEHKKMVDWLDALKSQSK